MIVCVRELEGEDEGKDNMCELQIQVYHSSEHRICCESCGAPPGKREADRVTDLLGQEVKPKPLILSSISVSTHSHRS